MDHSGEPIASLVLTALKQSKISGLSEVLKKIAVSLNGCGSILWQIAPVSELNKTPPQGRLFVQAEWFQANAAHRIHELPLTSLTGEAILLQKPSGIVDVTSNAEIYADHRFLKESGIRALCSVPIAYSGKPWGALDIFRKVPTPFTTNELDLASSLASLVPALYQTIRDEVSYNLILKVNEILHRSERGRSRLTSKDEAKEILQRICKLVADTFQCMETSLFLEDPLEKPKTYELMATTWPWSHFPKRAYKKNDRRTLTSWVLSHPKRSVKIFDLAKFDRDLSAIHKEYPGLKWADSLKIREAALEYFHISDPRELQPLSFMAAPLTLSGHTLGVIRCCTAKRGPYYFAEHEANLLSLVGTQISQFWNNWLRQHEIQEENDSWKALVKNVGRLNNFVRAELKKEKVDEGNIYTEALRVTGEVISGADILDVRLRSNEGDYLVFAKTWGKFWHHGTHQKVQERLNRRFPLDGESAGAHVFRTGEVYETSDVRRAVYYDATFKKLTKRMIVAPIRIESDSSKEPYGVLDIRGTGDRPFPKHAKAIAELLGQQLGLYHFLVDAIGKLHKAEAELKRTVKKQTQTFEDLEHQLRSPIRQAYGRVQSLLRNQLNDPELENNLLTIRGLCGKARQVTMSVGLYSDLAAGSPIRTRTSRLTSDYLYKTLVEAALDARLLVDPRRYITFQINKESFDVLQVHEVMADRDLLEQAVNNILDNAYKYSFERTTIRIYGGLTGRDRFHISVANKGIPIRGDEVRHIAERGWRSEKAKLTTGEGSGIGLWIVDYIMKAHGGELIIMPTSPNGLTEIKLVFPTLKTK